MISPRSVEPATAESAATPRIRAISGRVHRPEVGDDRQRLERSLRQPALHGPLEQPPASLGRFTRGTEGPATRNRLQHDPAATLVIALGEQPERQLDPLMVVLRRSHELLHGQRRARDDEQCLERPRELVERIGGD